MAEKTPAADPAGCVAVVEVQPGSPAWNVGLRAVSFISHVDNARISTPKQFYAAVADKKGEVSVRLSGGRGEEARRTIPP
jgi:S1-C subfamily serine protease